MCLNSFNVNWFLFNRNLKAKEQKSSWTILRQPSFIWFWCIFVWFIHVWFHHNNLQRPLVVLCENYIVFCHFHGNQHISKHWVNLKLFWNKNAEYRKQKSFSLVALQNHQCIKAFHLEFIWRKLWRLAWKPACCKLKTNVKTITSI